MKKRLTKLVGKEGLAESAEQAREEIRKRAYELYERRGRGDGRDLDDWLTAEAEVMAKANRQ